MINHKAVATFAIFLVTIFSNVSANDKDPLLNERERALQEYGISLVQLPQSYKQTQSGLLLFVGKKADKEGFWEALSRVDYLDEITSISLRYQHYGRNAAASPQPVDLSVLKAFPNLEEVALQSTAVSNLEALGELEKLRVLQFENMRLGQAESLSNVLGLEYLILNQMSWETFSPLSALSNLTRLKMTKVEVSDCNSLNGLTPLEELEIHSMTLQSLDCVTNLQNLHRLAITNGGPPELAPALELKSLKDLYLFRPSFRDFDIIASMSQLAKLRLAPGKDYELKNYKFIADLTGLEELAVENVPVTNLALFKDLPNLRKLVIRESKIKDLSPLTAMSQLEELTVEGNLSKPPSLRGLNALTSLTNLRSLNLRRTTVDDLSSVRELTLLENLDMSRTRIADTSPLQNLTRLKNLQLSNTKVADISALKGMQQLEALHIQSTKVSDISVIEHLTSLEYLWLGGSPIMDFSPVTQLPALKYVEGLPGESNVAVEGPLVYTEDDINQYINDKTLHFFDRGHGNQIEYMSPDGLSYLWYPGNTDIVVGEWQIRDSFLLCFKYGENTFNPLTQQRGGKFECSTIRSTAERAKQRWDGDVFQLRDGLPSTPLSKFGTIPSVPATP